MKHRMSLVGVFVCVACLALALTGCSKSSEHAPETEMPEPAVSSPAIGKEGTLRVGIGGGAPFVVSSSDDSASGFDVDMAAAIAGQLGLKLEVVSLDSNGGDADMESVLADGDVDVVMGATDSDKSGKVWVSAPYTQTSVTLFAEEGTDAPTRSSSPKISAQASSTSAWAVTNAFGDDALLSKGDLLSAFSAVEAGDASYVAADAVIGTYAAVGQNVDVAPVAVLGTIGGYGVAAAADNVELQEALSTVLDVISSDGVSQAICSKWLGTPLDLESLPAVEVSSSLDGKDSEGNSSQDDEKSGDRESESNSATDKAASDSESDDGVEPKTEAGANAIVPGTGMTPQDFGATGGQAAQGGVPESPEDPRLKDPGSSSTALGPDSAA